MLTNRDMDPKISIHIHTFPLFEGAHDVMVIIIGNGHSDTSSNPERD